MSPETLHDLEQKGEILVARLLAQHEYGVPGSELRLDVEAWLTSKQIERELASSAKSNARAEEQLRLAKQQRNIAIVALVVSAVTAIAAAAIGGVLSYSSSSPIRLGSAQSSSKPQLPNASSSAPPSIAGSKASQ